MELSLNKDFRIAVLIPYFGNQPEWFDYFLLSCSYNKNFIFIIFSDSLPVNSGFENIRFEQMQLDEFNKLATKKLGFTISIKHPFKICDLRPSFGIIFSDYLKDFNYWGYADLDLIFGDIAKMLPKITSYDVISNHSDFIPGHFCLVKNTDFLNNLFKECRNYQEIFQSNNYFGFDERIHWIKIASRPALWRVTKSLRNAYILIEPGLYNLYKKLVPSKKTQNQKELTGQHITKEPLDFTSLVRYYESIGKLTVHFKTTYVCDMMFRKKAIKNWKIEWNNGQLIFTNENKMFVYFHFMFSKDSKKFRISPYKSGIKRFCVSSKGINVI